MVWAALLDEDTYHATPAAIGPIRRLDRKSLAWPHLAVLPIDISSVEPRRSVRRCLLGKGTGDQMTRFRPGPPALVTATASMVFVLIGFVMVVDPDGPGSRTVGLAVLAFGLYWIWRELQVVDVGRDGVVVRQLFRSRSYPREAFSDVGSIDEGIVNQLSVPGLRRVDGEFLQFPSLRAFSQEKIEDTQRAILTALGDE